MSSSLRSHEPQYTRPPCPSPAPGVHPNHVHWVGDAIQSSHPLSSPSPSALNLSQHQGLFKWVSSSSCNMLIGVATATAKSLQSCPTLCDPIDGSPTESPVPGILQARTLEWVAISFSNAWKWKVKAKSLSHVQLVMTPWTAAYQAPPSMGFSRQEYWSGVPLPSMCIQIHTYEISTVEALGNWLHSSTSFFFYCRTFQGLLYTSKHLKQKQENAIGNYFLNRLIHPTLFFLECPKGMWLLGRHVDQRLWVRERGREEQLSFTTMSRVRI